MSVVNKRLAFKKVAIFTLEMPKTEFCVPCGQLKVEERASFHKVLSQDKGTYQYLFRSLGVASEPLCWYAVVPQCVVMPHFPLFREAQLY